MPELAEGRVPLADVAAPASEPTIEAPAAAAAAPAAEDALRKPRRKRTWEAADDVPPAVSASDALAQARLVAERTSGMISVSAGVLPGVIAPPPTVAPAPPTGMTPPAGLPPPPGLPPGPAHAPAVLTREIEINQSKNKAALTRKATHEQIFEATGTTVSIRGRYKPPGDTSTDERPLHLLLHAPTAEALDKAEAQLRELMGPPVSAAEAAAAAAAATATAASAAAAGAKGVFEAKVPVELGPGFSGGSVRGKVLGPRGTYIRHIETEAGVRVQLVGGHEPILPGQPVEPLTIEITAGSERQLALAKELAESLVRAVRQKLTAGGGGQPQPPQAYVAPQGGLPQPPPPPPGFHAPPPAPGYVQQQQQPPPLPYAHPAASQGSYPPPHAFAPPASYGPPASYPPSSYPPPSFLPPASFAPPSSCGSASSYFGPPSSYAAACGLGCGGSGPSSGPPVANNSHGVGAYGAPPYAGYAPPYPTSAAAQPQPYPQY